MKYQFDTLEDLKKKLYYAKWSLDRQNPHSIYKSHTPSEIRARQAEIAELKRLVRERKY